MIKDKFLVFIKIFRDKRIVAIVMLAVMACGIISGITLMPFFTKRDGNLAKEELTRDVETLEVTLSDIGERIELPGQVVFKEKVNLSSKINGRISKILVKEGQKVKKGKLVAQVERLNLEISLKQQKDELEIAMGGLELAEAKYGDALKAVEIQLRTIKKAQAELEDARVSFENMNNILKNKKILFKAGGVSKTELRDMKAQHTTSRTKYELAEANLNIQKVGYRNSDIITAGFELPESQKEKIEILKTINTRIEKAELEAAKVRVRQSRNNIYSTELMLKETNILSPINGVVAARNMEAGEMVREDSVIATVIDISSVYVSMNVKERDIPVLKKGQDVSFTVDALGEEVFKGKLDIISPILDTKTRTVEVKSFVKNHSMRLLPGMFVRSSIERGTKVRGIFIPCGALIGKDSLNVYVVRKGFVMKERIVTGFKIDGNIEVKEGLHEGDRIIVKGQSLVYEGMKLSG